MRGTAVRNVQQALPETCHQMRVNGVRRESRNGPVIMFPTPYTTVYTHPTERVIFWPERDANPFFHLMEAIWMLAGRDDVAFVSQFNSGMGKYSDDGVRFNAAYGYRWRNHFERDQLKLIADALKANPDCRRQVLSMWDGFHDLALPSKDVPCNTHAYFQRNVEGALDMMVSNRSNDLIWGAYGANAVHFSLLQEYMAALIGCPVGMYYQVSMNTHLYLEPHEVLLNQMADRAPQPPSVIRIDPYELNEVQPFPLMTLPAGRWHRELELFMRSPLTKFDDPFFEQVAKPLYQSYMVFKGFGSDRFGGARAELRNCIATDWHKAAWEWLSRREKAWMLKSA